jgi:hypothetical protein
VRTTDTDNLHTNDQLQLARVRKVDGLGIYRVVEIDADDGRKLTLAFHTSLERVYEKVEPLPLPG